MPEVCPAGHGVEGICSVCSEHWVDTLPKQWYTRAELPLRFVFEHDGVTEVRMLTRIFEALRDCPDLRDLIGVFNDGEAWALERHFSPISRSGIR